MKIFLILLTIIGILLLAVLAFVLLFLFHPVYYSIRGQMDGEPSAKGYFWWFFQILRIEFEADPDGFFARIRIFGFAKSLTGEKEGSRPKQMKQKPGQTPEFRLQETDVRPKEDVPKDVPERNGVPTKDMPEDKDVPKDVPEEKGILHEKKKKRREKKPKKASSGFSYWKEIIRDEKNLQALSHLRHEIFRFLSCLKPKAAQAEVSYCTGDPAVTGQLTGALSMMPVFYYKNVHVYPDFASECAYVRGTFFIKGHTGLFPVVCILIRLFRDPNLQRLYHKIRK